MRKAWLCLTAITVFASCAHAPSVPAAASPDGDIGTYPVFAIDPKTSRALGDGTVEVTGPFKACAATFVAPHLLVTSATVFPESGPSARRSDVPVIVRVPDGRQLRVRVAYVGAGDGIAILRSDESGRPVRLSGRMPADGEVLKAFGYWFGNQPPDKALPPAELYVQPVRAMVDPYSDGPRFERFRIDTPLRPGSCGTPLIDRDGRLAGIVHMRHGEWMSVIAGSSVAAAIGSL